MIFVKYCPTHKIFTCKKTKNFNLIYAVTVASYAKI